MPRVEIGLRGRWRVLRRERDTGKVLPPLELGNTIQTQGKYDFLDLMCGLGTPDVYNNANTDLRIYNSTPTLQKTLNCASGYPSPGSEDSGTVVYLFEDFTTDSYEAYRLDIYNAASAHVFSQATENLGTKPSNQDWTYEYTLSITQNGDSELFMDGLDHALRWFTGERHYGIAKEPYDNGTEILVSNAARTVTNTVACDATYPQRSGTTVTWHFTSAAGQDSQEWYYVKVRTDVNADESPA
ncbi:MAG: hypothetical protein ACWGQW_15655, partial [bacterium]